MSSDTFVSRFSRARYGAAPVDGYRCGLTAATIASWICGGLRLSGCRGCNPDLAAELIYVPAILARSSA
jgi:hypothetical protein